MDTTPPSISQVTSTTNDGTYKSGDVIAITINLSEAVIVSGSPQLTLKLVPVMQLLIIVAVVDLVHWFLIIPLQMVILQQI